MQLREFNDAGVARFRSYLESARRDLAAAPPGELLEDAALTRPVMPEVNLGRPGFVLKRDAAEYLHRALAPLPEASVLRNQGLWTWLSLYYFDEVCPPIGGQRRVLADYYYVYEAQQALYYYRHLLRVSYEVRRRAPHDHRLFLNSSMSSLGSVTERVMRRLYLTRIPCIFEVMDRLYYDPAAGRAKRRILSTPAIAGDLQTRLPLRIRQLQKTYDLNVLTADQLLQLLGSEFEHWQSQPDLIR